MKSAPPSSQTASARIRRRIATRNAMSDSTKHTAAIASRTGATFTRIGDPERRR